VCATDYNSGTRLYTMTLDFSMRDLPDKMTRVHAESVWQTIFFFPFSFLFSLLFS